MIKLKKKGEELEIPKFLRTQGNGDHKDKDKKRKKTKKSTTYGQGRVIFDDNFISITAVSYTQNTIRTKNIIFTSKTTSTRSKYWPNIKTNKKSITKTDNK